MGSRFLCNNTKLAVVEAKARDRALTEGVDELALDKLTPLLRLKYHDAIADAVADLGPAEEIRSLFTGFQRHLYEDATGGATHAA